MIKIIASTILTGDNFSPSVAEEKSKVIFSKKNEPWEEGTEGRFNGKKIPFGSAEFTNYQEDRLIEILTQNIDIFRTCGAEDISLHFDIVFEDQCNIEFGSEMLLKIARLQIPFTITCYEDEIDGN